MKKQKTGILLSALTIICLMICLTVSVAARRGRQPAETSEAATGLTFAEMFPDDNSRAYVTRRVLMDSTDAKGDDDRPTAAQMSIIESCTSIKTGGSPMCSLKGISYFSALERLDCNSNQLTELDVSQNTALYELNCCFNQLAKLDLGNNSKLYSDRADVSPQSITSNDVFIEASETGYKLALAKLVSGIDLSRVTMNDGGSLDASTGIVTYTEKPETVSYLYQTNSPDGITMDVNWTPVFAESTVLAGDLDGDGMLSSADVVMLAKYLVGTVTLTDDQIAAADLNGDGAVTAADTVLLAKKLLSGN